MLIVNVALRTFLEILSTYILRDQKQRKVGQNIARIGAWNQESEKLETSLVPRDTLCETPTVKT